jgi:mannose-6-phosphate isomerase-like protein (cupin superfamily)
MTGYIGLIEKETLENTNFRKVLYTGDHSQLVVMSIRPNETIGMEVHSTVDQFFRIEQGSGKVIRNGVEDTFEEDYGFIVPAGVEHDVINTGDTDLKLYTIYSPPNHPDGTIHKTKEEAEEYERHAHA